uniref:Uncharacterized protein n=1 Tax=Eptatretus burgeri TaxID=7764 RepID=A0A8C4R7X6_EPTBU
MLCSSGVEKIIKIWSPYTQPGGQGDLDGVREEPRRALFSHEEYIGMVLSSGNSLAHDYGQQSLDEDPRMMAFFDSLVQRELDGWSSPSESDGSLATFAWLRDSHPLRGADTEVSSVSGGQGSESSVSENGRLDLSDHVGSQSDEGSDQPTLGSSRREPLQTHTTTGSGSETDGGEQRAANTRRRNAARTSIRRNPPPPNDSTVTTTNASTTQPPYSSSSLTSSSSSSCYSSSSSSSLSGSSSKSSSSMTTTSEEDEDEDQVRKVARVYRKIRTSYRRSLRECAGALRWPESRRSRAVQNLGGRVKGSQHRSKGETVVKRHRTSVGEGDGGRSQVPKEEKVQRCKTGENWEYESRKSGSSEGSDVDEGTRSDDGKIENGHRSQCKQERYHKSRKHSSTLRKPDGEASISLERESNVDASNNDDQDDDIEGTDRPCEEKQLDEIGSRLNWSCSENRQQVCRDLVTKRICNVGEERVEDGRKSEKCEASCVDDLVGSGHAPSVCVAQHGHGFGDQVLARLCDTVGLEPTAGLAQSFDAVEPTKIQVNHDNSSQSCKRSRDWLQTESSPVNHTQNYGDSPPRGE